MKRILITLFCLLSFSVFAADGAQPGIKWDQPLLNEDGTALTAAEIDSFELHYTVDEPFAENAKPQIIKASERSYSLNLKLPARVTPYTVQMGLKTVSIYGTKSKMSNVVSTTFTAQSTKVPAAPVNIRISFICDTTCKIVDQTVETVK